MPVDSELVVFQFALDVFENDAGLGEHEGALGILESHRRGLDEGGEAIDDAVGVEPGVAHAVERRLGPELGLNLVAAHPLLGADGQRDLVAEGGLHAEACLFAFARRGVGEVGNVDGAGELVAVPPRSHLRREHRADVVAELEVRQVDRPIRPYWQPLDQPPAIPQLDLARAALGDLLADREGFQHHLERALTDAGELNHRATPPPPRLCSSKVYFCSLELGANCPSMFIVPADVRMPFCVSA